MDKRFTAKDFVFLVILSLIAILILLAMYMVDRQWLKMAEIQHVMTEQAEDMRGLRTQLGALERQIQSGVVSAVNPGRQLQGDMPPAFRRAAEASALAEFSEGDWFVKAFAQGIKTLTPLVSTDAYASQVQDFVFESLLTYDPDTLELVGLIARDWSVSDDGLIFTFNIRDDVNFSDGRPMTAEDIAFSFDFIMNEKIAAPRERAYYAKIKRVVAKGKHQVVFEFKEPYYNSLLLAGSLDIMPKHFYSEYLQKPDAYNQSKGLVLGSGPYRLKDPKGWTPDQGLVELVRNPRYWGPVVPSYDRVMWKVIEHDSARLTTFRNGGIDLYGARPREYKTLLADEALTQRAQNFEYLSPTSGYSYIGWNQSRNETPTWFADRRVRQAMTYLTDRQKIIDEIYLGFAEAAIGPFNPRGKQHDPTLKPRQPNVEQAKKLLSEAGFEDRDGDGVLEDKQGKRFEFELVFPRSSDDAKRMALLLKDLYARAGVVLKPKPTEWPVMLELTDNKNFDAIAMGWTGTVESDLFQIFHSSQTLSRGDNFIGYKNPELDKLIEQARATVDIEKRMPLWQAATRILFEDQPYTFLVRRKSLVFLDRRIRNAMVTNFGLNTVLVPVETFVPAAQQRYTN